MFFQHQNTKVGDMFIVETPSWGKTPSTYSEQTPVTKVTETQFTLEIDGKPVRFRRSDGRQHGFSGSKFRAPQALIVTDELMAEIAQERAEHEKQEKQKAIADRQKEIAMRSKYKSLHITDDAIQETFLAPLRSMAENAEEEINGVLREFDGVSVKADNFHHVAETMKRAVERGEVEFGQRLHELAMDFHTDMVAMLTDFANGESFEVDGTEITNTVDLAMAATRHELNKMLDRFFGWRFRSADVSRADQKYISELRGILRDPGSSVRVRRIEKGEESCPA